MDSSGALRAWPLTVDTIKHIDAKTWTGNQSFAATTFLLESRAFRQLSALGNGKEMKKKWKGNEKEMKEAKSNKTDLLLFLSNFFQPVSIPAFDFDRWPDEGQQSAWAAAFWWPVASTRLPCAGRAPALWVLLWAIFGSKAEDQSCHSDDSWLCIYVYIKVI